MKVHQQKLLITLFSFLIIFNLFTLNANATDFSTIKNAVLNKQVMLLLLYIFLALFFSFMCSIAEAVLLSVTPSYIEDLKGKKPNTAKLLKKLKQDNVDQSLAAILTLNTIAHTIGAIGAGAQASIVLGNTWFGVFSAVMTLMILFLSEIVPKTIGAVFWTKLTGVTAIFVNWLIFLMYPMVIMSEIITKFISRNKKMHIFSRDEFLAMAKIGEQTGELNKKESKIIKNMFQFQRIRVSDIMTPRIVISSLKQDITVEEAMKSVSTTPFSRLPIFSKNIDDITGFVLKNDILLASAQNQNDKPVSEFKREIKSVPDSASLLTVLEQLLNNSIHIAAVIDEYGGTSGIVTLEDLFETLMGIEIMDEKDVVEDMRLFARKLWEKRMKKHNSAMEK